MFCLLLRICLLNSTINEKRTRNPSPNKTRAKTTVRTIASSSAVSSRGVYTHTHTLSLSSDRLYVERMSHFVRRLKGDEKGRVFCITLDIQFVSK
jgi:hypothetical protein